MITLVAELCETGEIATAYRSLAGATDLDRDVWRLPCWQNYFDAGTINLDLPLLDANGQPIRTDSTVEMHVRDFRQAARP